MVCRVDLIKGIIRGEMNLQLSLVPWKSFISVLEDLSLMVLLTAAKHAIARLWDWAAIKYSIEEMVEAIYTV